MREIHEPVLVAEPAARLTDDVVAHGEQRPDHRPAQPPRR